MSQQTMPVDSVTSATASPAGAGTGRVRLPLPDTVSAVAGDPPDAIAPISIP